MLLCAALTSAFLVGCESAPPPGTIGSIEGFAGAVAADEPRAALIARDTLSAGGNAADAAVALYFALSVTLPSTAGLGGGGTCLIHDPTGAQPQGRQTVALDFLPRPTPDGRVAVPGNVRGMAALHARYGRLRWEQLLSPAENLARFGTPVSRALAREITTAGEKLLRDPEVRRIFAGPGGALIAEGDVFRQVELAAVLAQIRLKGAGALYTDQLAARLAEAAQSIGAPLTPEALRGAAPAFRDTTRIGFGNHSLHVSQPPAAGGVVTAALLQMLTEGHAIESVPAEERAHLFAEASARAFIDRDRWMAEDGSSREPAAALVSLERAESLMDGYKADVATAGADAGATSAQMGSPPENPWATGFVVVDNAGAAVACNITMNDLFGSGRMAPGTGIILAPAPRERPGSIALGPMIMANEQTGRVFYAAAASGGPTAPTAMAGVFLRAAVEGQSLETAIEAKRLHHNGVPDIVFHEAGESDETLTALTQRKHTVREAGILGRVNAVWCPGGLPTRPETCEARSDPRANGLATILAE